MISENLNMNLNGFIKIESVNELGIVEETIKKNLVVNNALNIIRDLLIYPGIQNQLSLLKIGTLGLVYGTPYKLPLPSPISTDTDLFANLLTINATQVSPTIIGIAPAIEIVFKVGIYQANSSNPNIFHNLLAEFGLCTTSGLLFSRVVVPIIKLRNNELIITWTILI